MLPEGVPVENYITTVNKATKEMDSNSNKLLNECTENYEVNSYKNLKGWKKSISSFFRNQLRSSKSNEGDSPSGSNGLYDEKEVTTEQKWKSLGKIFRRQSFNDQNPYTEREANSQKVFAVRSVLSNYFRKYKATENSNGKN